MKVESASVTEEVVPVEDQKEMSGRDALVILDRLLQPSICTGATRGDLIIADKVISSLARDVMLVERLLSGVEG